MAALMGKTEVGIREFGSTANVPNDPTGRLMYYLHCICAVLDMSDHPGIERLTDYRRYYNLSEDEINTLALLCVLLSPDELNGKVIFQNDTMCKGSNNQFYELSAVRSTLLLTNTVLVGGQQRAVSKIMAYKREWLIDNWITPMTSFKQRLERMTRTSNVTARRDDDGGCCCTIL